MNDARAAILHRIRQNTSAKSERASGGSAQEWTTRHVRGPSPDWEVERQTRLIAKLEEAEASVVRLASAAAVAAAVADYGARHDLPTVLVAAATTRLRSLDWPEEWTVEHRAAHAGDRLVLSEAYCAVAETGSVVLLSGPQTPTSLNFLTDHFVCVLPASRIVDTIDDVWGTMRAEATAMPRAVNFVTGPSRTADVEQTIQLGAHGPRFVHVLLLDAE